MRCKGPKKLASNGKPVIVRDASLNCRHLRGGVIMECFVKKWTLLMRLAGFLPLYDGCIKRLFVPCFKLGRPAHDKNARGGGCNMQLICSHCRRRPCDWNFWLEFQTIWKTSRPWYSFMCCAWISSSIHEWPGVEVYVTMNLPFSDQIVRTGMRL